MIALRLLGFAGLAFVLTAPAVAQNVTTKDRVLAGNAALSTSGKEAILEDTALGKVVRNPKVHFIILQQRIGIAASGEKEKEPEYWAIYAVERETRLRSIKISKSDYDRLIKLADRLDPNPN